MAGQPPEGSWQSAAQAAEAGNDQARAAWQPAYEQQSYEQPRHEQPPYEQPQYEQPSYEAPRSGHAYEQRVSGDAPGQAKGLVASLFDFGFTSFVTPKLIKLLYALATIWTVLWAIVFVRLAFRYGGFGGGIFTLIIVMPVFLLLSLGVIRVFLEVFMVLHRIHEDLEAVRERGDRGAGTGL